MQSAHIWMIAGMTGALFGAAATYYAIGNNTPAMSPTNVSQSKVSSRDQEKNVPVASISGKSAQDSPSVQRDFQPKSGIKTELGAATPSETTGAKKPDPAEEEAMVQIVTSRLYNPTMTLAGIMQSEEMTKLSDEARERVVVKMVGMLNRGEIDARTFMAGGN